MRFTTSSASSARASRHPRTCSVLLRVGRPYTLRLIATTPVSSNTGTWTERSSSDDLRVRLAQTVGADGSAIADYLRSNDLTIMCGGPTRAVKACSPPCALAPIDETVGDPLPPQRVQFPDAVILDILTPGVRPPPPDTSMSRSPSSQWHGSTSILRSTKPGSPRQPPDPTSIVASAFRSTLLRPRGGPSGD